MTIEITGDTSLSAPKALLGKRCSAFFRAYYQAPDHPCKLRLLGLALRALGKPGLLVPYAEHSWIALSPGDALQQQILVQHYYEPEVWDALAPYISAEEVLWDAGAHIGSFALRAAHDVRIREVRCFEPHPELQKQLLLNMQLNGLNFKIEALALSDKCEEKLLFPPRVGNSGTASLQERPAPGTMKVSCATVDSIIAAGASPPTLMKVDIEGFELQLFRGAAQLFATAPPKAIVFEALPNADGSLRCNEIFQLLTSSGFVISHIRRPNRQIYEVENYLALLQKPYGK